MPGSQSILLTFLYRETQSQGSEQGCNLLAHSEDAIARLREIKCRRFGHIGIAVRPLNIIYTQRARYIQPILG